MNKKRNISNKKYLLTGIISILSINVFAQNTSAPAPLAKEGIIKIFDYDASTWLLILVFSLMTITILVLYSALKTLSHHYNPVEKKSKTVTDLPDRKSKQKESAWQIFDRKFLTRAVPVEREADIMLDHDYDGIRELDNSLPPWWKWGFVFTVVFAVVYLLSYHVAGTGKLQLQEYQDELTQAQNAKEERIKIAGENVNEETVVALSDNLSLTEGKNIFSKNCVACHLADGGGLVGPNLTDDYWIHGGGIKNIFATITNGVPAKGMISWKAQLAPKQIQQVASFVMTLQGTKPAVAKEPQGDKWIEAVTPAADTSKTASMENVPKK